MAWATRSSRARLFPESDSLPDNKAKNNNAGEASAYETTSRQSHRPPSCCVYVRSPCSSAVASLLVSLFLPLQVSLSEPAAFSTRWITFLYLHSCSFATTASITSTVEAPSAALH